jgi:hypothetical protein
VTVRLRQAALLASIAVLAAIGVAALPAAGLPRVAAGLLLVLALPWLGASRLAALRDSDVEGSRLAGSGALALGLTILLGLILSTSGPGIDESRLAIGFLVLIAALAAIGLPGTALPRPGLGARNLAAAALTLAAVAVAVAAFVLARDRALSQGQEEPAYAAFLIEDGNRFDVGLRNATGSPARFTVRELGADGRAATVTVPARGEGTVPDFLRRPPALRPIEQVIPSSVRPVRIRVTARTRGRPVRPALELSTYAR